MLIEQPCGSTVLPVGTDIACPIPNQGRPSTCSIVFKGLSDYNAKSNTWGESTHSDIEHWNITNTNRSES